MRISDWSSDVCSSDLAARAKERTSIMARIGTFKKVSGEYRGQIVTLSVQAKLVRIVPEDNPSGNAPSHRVFIGEAEVGAAWEKKSQDKRPYLSVKPDDPTFEIGNASGRERVCQSV